MATIAVTDPSSTGGIPFLVSMGLGLGGIFITALLIYLLAYLNISQASETPRMHLNSLLVGPTIPFVLVFFGIMIYASLDVIGVF